MMELVTRIQVGSWQLRKHLRGEHGQTSSEYLVIAGVVVALLLVVLAYFKDEVSSAATDLVDRITGGIGGNP